MSSGNLLASAQSAYLRSAAHQPVQWHPWSEAAFAQARAQDKPVLLDIGAVWCHWCHVMDRESYEDPSLAEFLNQHFVCVKVDRDERPDVDTRYQRAIQAFTGQGGWPLTAFLTPAGEAFYGGTYFPPDGKYGRPGFRSVLTQVLEVYRNQRERVGTQAGAVRRLLAEDLNEAQAGEVTPGLLTEAVTGMARLFDQRHGGFGSQPKFPHPAAITVLLNAWYREPTAPVRAMIDLTLSGMARGGVHDQLGGGFHRYSVDARWIVPHFEKMSYDNAGLLRAYLDAYGAFGTAEYAEVARSIVRWVREVLADPAGGYGASQDADVGLDDDGDYFTWTLAEAAALLPPEELEVAAAYYDIGTAGEMDHDPSKNVLFVADTIDRIAGRQGRTMEQVAVLLAGAQAKLRDARDKRTAPFIDGTRYSNWNAMLAGALLQAGAVLGDPWPADHALTTLRRLRDESAAPDAVAHSPGGVEGLLEDQVQVALAALDAHTATGDPRWLEWSERIMTRVWSEYWDPEAGGFFDTANDRGGEGLLPTRAKPVQDAPTPSGNGVAGVVLARLHEITGGPIWRERLDALLAAFAGRVPELGLYGATFLLAVDWGLHPATHLVVVEAPGQRDEADRMHQRALATFLPRKIVQRVRPEAPGALLPPPVQGMLATGGGTRAFACIGTRCLAPATNDAEWKDRLTEAAGV
jgi:hypothetical protein